MKKLLAFLLIPICLISALFLFLLISLPSAADADDRNNAIALLEQNINLPKEFENLSVRYYGTKGHVNSYHAKFYLYVDKECELPESVNTWFRHHSLRLWTEVELWHYNPELQETPFRLSRRFYW